ncbi:MAG: uridine kinase [Bdellovibrionia bacterium]
MFLVGIAGGSGSGKTTFAKKILNRVPGKFSSHVAILHQDSYYLPTPDPELRVHGEPNFDHPRAFDWALLKQHLHQLKNGGTIEVPVYDFKMSRRTQETLSLGPCATVLMEGIFTLWEEDVRHLFDLKIYLNVEADIRFIRRLHRDVKERGRSIDSIIRQYYDTVRPMHHEFLEPTRQYADLVVGEETDIAAEVVAARINSAALGEF